MNLFVHLVRNVLGCPRLLTMSIINLSLVLLRELKFAHTKLQAVREKFVNIVPLNLHT